MLLFFQENWANIFIELVGIILTFFIIDRYLIPRYNKKLQKSRELPLKRSLLFNIVRHFDVILAIYLGFDLSFYFIDEDANVQFRKEVTGLNQASYLIGFINLPIDFLDKFFGLVAMINAPYSSFSELPKDLKYEHELSLAKCIKELCEIMVKIEVDIPNIMIYNVIHKAEEFIMRLESSENSRKRAGTL